jgi:hypothetical protein
VLAEEKGLRWLIIPGDNPREGPFTLRDLARRANIEGLTAEEIAQAAGEGD